MVTEKKREDQCHPDGVPKIAVGKDKEVIVNPHKAWRGDTVKLDFHEGIDNDLDQRKSDDQEHHEDCWQDQIPRQPLLAL